MRQSVRGANERLARERVITRAGAGGALRVCLVYPNTYRVGMSNLGFQAVFGIFGEFPGVSCERAFLPDASERRARKDVRSFESARPLGQFDVLAFSLSFETDYLNVVEILDAAGIELLARSRGRAKPLVIAGGPATFINPEPIADFFDLLLVGEAEEMVPEFLDALLAARDAGTSRERLLAVLGQVAGAYCPGNYEVAIPSSEQLAIAKPRGDNPARITRRYVRDLGRYPVFSRVLPAESVFDDMFLLEASRGCKWGCRFCAAGYIYRPARNVPADSLARLVQMGLNHSPNIGLVGAELGSLPGLAELFTLVNRRGGRLSPSSLRADTVTDGLARGLEEGVTRTVTIAPEAGSERLRRVIRKNLAESAILEAAARVAHQRVRTLRLYFMIGLPTETEADVLAIAALAKRIRDRFLSIAPVSRIHLSVNPFVPKPWTPFQWEGLEDVRSLKRKIALLRRVVGGIGGVRLEVGSPREAYYQTLLSRGDRRVSALLRAIHRAGGRWWPVLQTIRRGDRKGIPLDPDMVVHSTLSRLDPLPWEIIDQGISREFLWRERQRAFRTARSGTHEPLSRGACGI